MPLLASLKEFLEAYPGMSLRPVTRAGWTLSGKFSFEASRPDGGFVADAFDIAISIPSDFPRSVPTVREIGGRFGPEQIPHVNGDGTFCLGSPLQLLLALSADPTLLGFADRCLTPFLSAVSRRLRGEAAFSGWELAHGSAGLYEDYKTLFGVHDNGQVDSTLSLLELKPRRADHAICPCGCGGLLRNCSYRDRIDAIRQILQRGQIREVAASLRRQVAAEKASVSDLLIKES